MIRKVFIVSRQVMHHLVVLGGKEGLAGLAGTVDRTRNARDSQRVSDSDTCTYH